MDLRKIIHPLRKAWTRAIEITAQAVGSTGIERLAIVRVREESEAVEVYNQLSKSIPYSGEGLYAELTPGLSVHAGAGMVGACFVASV